MIKDRLSTKDRWRIFIRNCLKDKSCPVESISRKKECRGIFKEVEVQELLVYQKDTMIVSLKRIK